MVPLTFFFFVFETIVRNHADIHPLLARSRRGKKHNCADVPEKGVSYRSTGRQWMHLRKQKKKKKK